MRQSSTIAALLLCACCSAHAVEIPLTVAEPVGAARSEVVSVATSPDLKSIQPSTWVTLHPGEKTEAHAGNKPYASVWVVPATDELLLWGRPAGKDWPVESFGLKSLQWSDALPEGKRAEYPTETRHYSVGFGYDPVSGMVVYVRRNWPQSQTPRGCTVLLEKDPKKAFKYDYEKQGNMTWIYDPEKLGNACYIAKHDVIMATGMSVLDIETWKWRQRKLREGAEKKSLFLLVYDPIHDLCFSILAGSDMFTGGVVCFRFDPKSAEYLDEAESPLP
jgi:hypothetical protein